MCENTQLKTSILQHVDRTSAYLKHLPSKVPQPQLNAALTQLVELVRPAYDSTFVMSVLGHAAMKNHICDLRCHLAECEFELEKFWATKILNGEAQYHDYPYMESYRALLASEMHFFKTQAPSEKARLCFVGSGPLPITAFEFRCHYPEMQVTCVEMDAAAVFLSQQVAEHSLLQIDFAHGTAQEMAYENFDIILLASMTLQKPEVMDRICRTAKAGTLIAVRSVEGLRHFLYEPLDPAVIPPAFEYLGCTPYRPEQINTTLFYRLQN